MPLDVILTDKELFWYGVDEDDSTVTEEDQEVVVPSSNIALSGSQLDHLQSLIITNIREEERIPKYVELVGVVHAMLSRIIRTIILWGGTWGKVTGPFRGLRKVMSVPKNACSVVEEKDMEVQSGFTKLSSS